MFNSGAGYVLNSKALKLWYETCGDSMEMYEQAGSMEDVAMAECLRKVRVVPVDTRDKFGAERFHAFTPSQTARLRFSAYVEYTSFVLDKDHSLSNIYISRYDPKLPIEENEYNMRMRMWVWNVTEFFEPLDGLNGISDTSVSIVRVVGRKYD